MYEHKEGGSFCSYQTAPEVTRLDAELWESGRCHACAAAVVGMAAREAGMRRCLMFLPLLRRVRLAVPDSTAWCA